VNKLFTNNIGDLAEAQRASFYRFLSTGISEELANFPNPFLAKIRVSLPGAKPKKSVCLVSLDINKVKLKGPNFNFLTCVKKDISYTIQIYVSSEYSYFHETISGARIFDEKIKKFLLNLSYLKKIFTLTLKMKYLNQGQIFCN
jgi:hypothetical protein